MSGEGMGGRVLSLHALLQDQSDGSTPHPGRQMGP